MIVAGLVTLVLVLTNPNSRDIKEWAPSKSETGEERHYRRRSNFLLFSFWEIEYDTDYNGWNDTKGTYVGLAKNFFELSVDPLHRY